MSGKFLFQVIEFCDADPLMAYDKDDENEKDGAKEARTKVVLATAASRSEGRQARGAGKQVDKLGELASRGAGEQAGEEGEQANR